METEVETELSKATDMDRVDVDDIVIARNLPCPLGFEIESYNGFQCRIKSGDMILQVIIWFLVG